RRTGAPSARRSRTPSAGRPPRPTSPAGRPGRRPSPRARGGAPRGTGAEAVSCDRAPPHLTQVRPPQERREQVAVVVRGDRDRLDPERAEVPDEALEPRLVRG